MSITSKIKNIDIQEALDKRFCDLAFSLLGKKVKISLDGKTKGEGLLYTINPSNGGIVLRDYSEKQANGEETNCAQMKRIEKKDFVFLFAENVDDPPFVQDLKNLKNKQNLRTDGEISKTAKDTTRKLQAVDFAFDSKEGLEDLEGLSSSKDKKKFNQFEVNQQKFGVGTDYKDEFYTTKLDYSKLDQGQIEQAERLEKEIKTEQSTNQHILIDRGHDYLMKEGDSDEEKHFSAVHGSGMYNNDGKVISRAVKKEDADSKQAITFGQGRPTFSNDKKELSATKKSDNLVQQIEKKDSNNQTKQNENKEGQPKQAEQLKETDKKEKDKKQGPIFVEKKQEVSTVTPVEEKVKVDQAPQATKAPDTNSHTVSRSGDAAQTPVKKEAEISSIAAPPNLSAPATAAESLAAAQGQPKKKLQLKKKTEPTTEIAQTNEPKPPTQVPPAVDSSQQAKTQFNQYPNQNQDIQYMQQAQYQQYPQFYPDGYGAPLLFPNQIGIPQPMMAPGFPQQPLFFVQPQQAQQIYFPLQQQPIPQQQQQQHQPQDQSGHKKNLKFGKNTNYKAE